MSKTKSIYNIKGVLFYQSEPEYLEHLRTLELVKEKFQSLKTNDLTLEELINKLMVEGTLEELFKIIVKPYQPNVAVKLWNAYQAKRNKIDLANPITQMKTTEIARVVADFFTYYSAWINGLLSFNQTLVSRKNPIQASSPVEN